MAMTLEELQDRAAGLKGGIGEAAQALVACLRDEFVDQKTPWDAEYCQCWRDLNRVIGWKEGMSAGEVFKPGDDLYSAVAELLGQDEAATARRLWERQLEGCLTYPGPYRFGYRTRAYSYLYLRGLVQQLLFYVAGCLAEFSLEEALRGTERDKFPSPMVKGPDALRARQMAMLRRGGKGAAAPLLGLRLDEGKDRDQWLERARAILADVSGETRVNRTLVAGLLRSRRPEAHAEAVKLMLGAGLLESQREAVLGAADSASREGFLAVYKAAAENELIRFSSTLGAFNQWAGVGFTAKAEDKNRAAFADGYRCLTDAKFRDACLNGDDALRLHLALWALGRDELQTALDAARRILQDGPRHRQAVALHYVAKISSRALRWSFALSVLEGAEAREDGQLLALATACAGGDGAGFVPRFDGSEAQEELARGTRFTEATPLYAKPEQVRQYYALFKELAGTFKTDAEERGGELALGGPERTTVRRGNMTAIMKSLAARAPGAMLNGVISDGGRSLGSRNLYEKVMADWGIPGDSLPFSFCIATAFVRDVLDDDPPETNIREDLSANFRTLGFNCLLDAVVRDGSGGPKQRAALFDAVADRRGTVGAGQYLFGAALSDAEYEDLESRLDSKNTGVRQQIYLKILMREPAGLGASVKRLLASRKAARRQAGSELLDILARKKDDPKYRDVYAECAALAGGAPAAKAVRGRSAVVVKTPAAAVTPKKAAETPATTDGATAPVAPPAVDPAAAFPLTQEEEAAAGVAFPAPQKPLSEDARGLYDQTQPVTRFQVQRPDPNDASFGDKLFPVTLAEVMDIYRGVDEVVAAHAGHEYKSFEYGREINDVVLGSARQLFPEWRDGYSEADRDRLHWNINLTLDDFTLTNEWREMLKRTQVRPQTAVVFNLLAGTVGQSAGFNHTVGAKLKALPAARRLLELFEQVNTVQTDQEREHAAGNQTGTPTPNFSRRSFANTLHDAFENEFPPDVRYPIYRPIAATFLDAYPEGINHLRECVSPENDANFADFFKLVYEWGYTPSGVGEHRVGLVSADLVRAYRQRLLPDHDMLRVLLQVGERDVLERGGGWEYVIQKLTSPFLSAQLIATAPGFKQLLDNLLDRVVSLEIDRGDFASPVSTFAGRTVHYEGARHFLNLLDRIGKANLDRTVLGRPVVGPGRQGGDPRLVMYCHLLRSCWPGPGENGDTLKTLRQGRDLSDQRLIDAAMYAPQWIPAVSACLGWPGLESMCWYFHAHVGCQANEWSETRMRCHGDQTAFKETMIAQHSDITPDDFADGAFDLDWFREAYAAIGDKHFTAVYAAAKYIGPGPRHVRAKLYADAVNGKLSLAETEKLITDKRSQNYVLAYGLIPFDPKDPEADQRRRYQLLRLFEKQSKQFGAKRRASESRAAALGLENLARNAGYDTPVRFIWKMEDAIARASDVFSPRRIGGDDNAGGVSACLAPDPDGNIALNLSRGDKALKSVPAALKKDPAYLDLQADLKTWRDQQSRARATLEESMVRQDQLDLEELATLAKNPVFAPLLGPLVYQVGDRIDYLDALVKDQVQGAAVLAHPLQLKNAGVWEKFQRDLFDRQIRQPFKQVFRELYSPTAKELATGTTSDRYSGYQVKPAQTMGLLKSKGWTAYFEAGIQKVCRREKIIARIDSMNTWLPPFGVESAPLGIVTFTPRHSHDPLFIKDVPPILFSEVMRDLDLVVSVAFAGGVDPETSLSTIEMRTAVAREAVRLFKLDNVTFKENHAFIQGKRAEYTLHMGSGVIHVMAQGALNVAAVLSQHRGRVFLPFADDDPRTAEIITKILIFARDGELKDPAILAQLRR